MKIEYRFGDFRLHFLLLSDQFLLVAFLFAHVCSGKANTHYTILLHSAKFCNILIPESLKKSALFITLYLSSASKSRN